VIADRYNVIENGTRLGVDGALEKRDHGAAEGTHARGNEDAPDCRRPPCAGWAVALGRPEMSSHWVASTDTFINLPEKTPGLTPSRPQRLPHPIHDWIRARDRRMLRAHAARASSTTQAHRAHRQHLRSISFNVGPTLLPVARPVRAPRSTRRSWRRIGPARQARSDTATPWRRSTTT